MKQCIIGSDLAEAIKVGGTNFKNLQVKGNVDLRGLKRTFFLGFTNVSFIGDLLLEKADLGRLYLEKVDFCKDDRSFNLILSGAHASEVNIRETNVAGAICARDLSVGSFFMSMSSADFLDFRSALFNSMARFSEIKARLAFFCGIKANSFKILSHSEVEVGVSLTSADILGEFELFGLSVGGYLDLTGIKSGYEMRLMEPNAVLSAKVGEGVICGNDIALALKCLAFFGPKGTRIYADFSGVAVALDALSKMKPAV